MIKADWYFDILSPFAYLQWATRDRLAGLVRLRPVPVVLGAILSHWDQRGPAEIQPKRFHTYRAALWRAQRLGVPLRFPAAHPFNPLPALRLIVALGAEARAVDAVLNAVFRDGRDVSDPDEIVRLGSALGLSNTLAVIAHENVKAELRKNTEGAIARGVFGVPTVLLNGELFWGEDMTDLVAAYATDPDCLDREELLRLRDLPVGVERIR